MVDLALLERIRKAMWAIAFTAWGIAFMLVGLSIIFTEFVQPIISDFLIEIAAILPVCYGIFASAVDYIGTKSKWDIAILIIGILVLIYLLIW